MPCTGCGLRENGITGDLEVASSEDWGSGALASFGGDDTVGAPVYCDSAGQLRTVPEHTSSTGEASASIGSTPVGSGGTVYAADANLVFNNPSAVRAASLFVGWSVALGVTVTGAGNSWTNLVVATKNLGALFTLNGTQNPANPGAASYVFNIVDHTVDTLAAGGTVTYDLDVGVTTAGGTTADFTSSAAIRVLAVTQ